MKLRFYVLQNSRPSLNPVKYEVENSFSIIHYKTQANTQIIDNTLESTSNIATAAASLFAAIN